MGQLPSQFRQQFRDLKLPAADVLVLADELPTAQYFNQVLQSGVPAKAAANWVMGDVMAHCKVASISAWTDLLGCGNTVMSAVN